MKRTTLATTWEAPGLGGGPVHLTVAVYGRAARWRAATKVFVLLLLPAVGALFIPVFHFFLVPGLLLAGMGAARWRLRLRAAAVAAAGACPACSTSVQVDLAQARLRPTLWALCPHCGERLRLRVPLTDGGFEPAGQTAAEAGT